MFSLTEEQIAFIENDIKVRGITSPDLSIDLLDHICCLIECKLDEYRNFETVYQETLLLFGEKGLKEIQDETNRLLTFKHYYIMNATMKISGYISSMLILFGAIFKFQHWPGASMMLVVGVFFLTVLFLPLLFILKFKSTAENNRSIVLSIIAFVSSLLLCIGILFRIMHWPNARIVIITGGVLLILGYLPIYFINVYKNTTNKINATATIILIIAGVGLFITESGTGLSRSVSDSFWRGVTESDQLLSFMNKESQIFYDQIDKKLVSDSTANSNSILKLHSKTDELISYMDAMKVYLISNTEQLSEEETKKLPLDDLRTAGGEDIINSIMMGNGNYSSTSLKSKINNYKESIKAISNTTDVSLLETDSLTVYGEKVSWEQSNFEKLPIPLVVFNITRIQLAVKSIESSLLNRIN